jgi:hypothetical protein
LRAARSLKVLNFPGTRIDDEHYVLLLSELPNIANIIFRRSGASILRHIAEERLDKITHVYGYIQDIDTVAHKCPNTTNIAIFPMTRDLSGLTTLNALSALEIHCLPYNRTNFKAALQGVGHRLTDLKLFHCSDVDLQDIITLCPSLANLSLMPGTFCYLHLATPLDPHLPHFRNLINLKIWHFLGVANIIRYIRYYVSLKTIELVDTSSFTVEFVRGVLNLGTYKELEALRIQENEPHLINEKALELLIGHCPLLKRIELVGSGVSGEEYAFGKLKRQILVQNFDLKLKLIDGDILPDYRSYGDFFD